MMLDEPHATKATYGYATAGWVVAPAAGKVIARIAPMMGMLPDLANMPAINQALAIPLEPGRPPGAPARGPGAPGSGRRCRGEDGAGQQAEPDGARHGAAAGHQPPGSGCPAPDPSVRAAVRRRRSVAILLRHGR